MRYHLRVRFDQELADLKDSVLLLGSLTRQAVAAGSRTFVDNDPEGAGEVIAADHAINDLRFRIEEQDGAVLDSLPCR